jgi:hypothetical protein
MGELDNDKNGLSKGIDEKMKGLDYESRERMRWVSNNKMSWGLVVIRRELMLGWGGLVK